jgi:hypothetical protein
MVPLTREWEIDEVSSRLMAHSSMGEPDGSFLRRGDI